LPKHNGKKTAAEADDEDDNNNNVTPDNTDSKSSSHIPVKMTSKMIQRAAYEKEIKEQDAMETDEDDLEVFEGDELPTRPENNQDTKGKGKETPPRAVIDEDTHISRNKRRRPVVDPFAGYGDDLASANSFTTKKVKSSEDSNRPPSSNSDPKPSANTQISSNSKQRSKAEKKAKKKTKGLAT